MRASVAVKHRRHAIAVRPGNGGNQQPTRKAITHVAATNADHDNYVHKSRTQLAHNRHPPCKQSGAVRGPPPHAQRANSTHPRSAGSSPAQLPHVQQACQRGNTTLSNKQTQQRHLQPRPKSTTVAAAAAAAVVASPVDKACECCVCLVELLGDLLAPVEDGAVPAGAQHVLVE